MLYYKILEQNGIENENIDGAGFQNFCAGGRNGIIKGVLNECQINRLNPYEISFTTGEVLIQGIRIKFEDGEYVKSFSSLPAESQEWHIVFRVEVDRLTRGIDFKIIERPREALVKDNLFEKELGTYEVEFATFSLSQNGVENYTRVMEVISAGGGSSVEVIEIDNIDSVYEHTRIPLKGHSKFYILPCLSSDSGDIVGVSGYDIDFVTIIPKAYSKTDAGVWYYRGSVYINDICYMNYDADLDEMVLANNLYNGVKQKWTVLLFD